MPVLKVRAELASMNTVIVWLKVMLVPPLVVVLLIAALA
jgi:hypothetical protein